MDPSRLTGRDEVIELRGRIGDLEGDTVLGPPGTGGVQTLVDRHSRLLVTCNVHCKEATHVATRMVERLKRAPFPRVRSVTCDKGIEFADRPRVAAQRGFDIFFLRAGAPRQRGTNENTNGLLRQYFPKGTRFEQVTAQQPTGSTTDPGAASATKHPPKSTSMKPLISVAFQIRDHRLRPWRYRVHCHQVQCYYFVAGNSDARSAD